MFASLIELGKNFVIEHGFLGLFVFSLTESVIQPIPVDPVLIAITANGFNPHYAFLIALVGSVIGASVSYFLGIKLGHPIAVRIFGAKNMRKSEKFLEKWGVWGVGFVAFTPLPFKVAAWSGGIFEMPFGRFMIACLVGRGMRFALASYLPHLLLF